MSKPIQHIAIMRLSAMGDVAMTVPVLRALVRQYPELKITVVSRGFFQPFFDEIPNVRFFAIDEKERHKGILGLWRLFLDLKKLEIDAFADLHNVLRSKFVRRLFVYYRKKVAAVDKGREDKKALTRSENKIFKPLPSMFERHQKVFEKLGFPIDLSNPIFPEKAKLNNPYLISIVNKSGKLIGIAPFAQYDTKVYPLDLMEDVIQQLSENVNYNILLFGGGQKEKEALEKLAANKDNVINMAGKMTFKDELALISHLDIMLSMDSGNAHIAAMLGKKVITLWGATHPFAGFLPFNQNLDLTLVSDRQKYPNLPTSVFGDKQIAGYEDAMRTILPSEVVSKLRENL